MEGYNPREDKYGCALDPEFVSRIDKSEVSATGTIIELGSFNLNDAIDTQAYYGCKVFSFDCNPNSLGYMRENLNKSGLSSEQIEICPYAVTDKTGPISFQLWNQDSVVTGCSSIYEADLHPTGDIPIETIEVQSTRLDDWLAGKEIDEIGLLIMDIQGAELRALEGLGDHLKKVRYVLTEGCYVNLYKDQSLIYDTEKYLKSWGFELQHPTSSVQIPFNHRENMTEFRNDSSELITFNNFLFSNTNLTS